MQVPESITGWVPDGVLPPRSTVAQGEAYAIARVCRMLGGAADVTSDCQAAVRQQARGPKPWPWLQAAGCETLASLTWIRSHTTRESFEAEFGRDQLWRRVIHEEADKACKQAALNALASLPVWCPTEVDELAREVNAFLNERAWVLLVCKTRPPWELAEGPSSPPRPIPPCLQPRTLKSI